MAEALIRVGGASHADPAVDRAGCYKHGDVVLFKPQQADIPIDVSGTATHITIDDGALFTAGQRPDVACAT